MAKEAPKSGVQWRKRGDEVGCGPRRVLYLLYGFALTGAGPAPALLGSHWALLTQSPAGGPSFAFTPSLVVQPRAEKNLNILSLTGGSLWLGAFPRPPPGPQPAPLLHQQSRP